MQMNISRGSRDTISGFAVFDLPDIGYNSAVRVYVEFQGELPERRTGSPGGVEIDSMKPIKCVCGGVEVTPDSSWWSTVEAIVAANLEANRELYQDRLRDEAFDMLDVQYV